LAITQDSARPKRILLALAYLVSFVALGLTWSGFMFQGVERIYGIYSPIITGGEGFILLFTFAVVIAYGMYLLYQRYRITTDTNEKYRLG
jgi:hypothetical protein